jgi:hypothetical protein
MLSDQVQGRALGALLLEDEEPAGPGAGQSQAGLWIRIRMVRINLSCWIRIRIQEGKNDPQK